MAKIIPISEHFQHFLAELKESFWGDVYGQTRQAWQRFFELESERQRDRFSGWARYERRRGKRPRNTEKPENPRFFKETSGVEIHT